MNEKTSEKWLQSKISLLCSYLLIYNPLTKTRLNRTNLPINIVTILSKSTLLRKNYKINTKKTMNKSLTSKLAFSNKFNQTLLNWPRLAIISRKSIKYSANDKDTLSPHMINTETSFGLKNWTFLKKNKCFWSKSTFCLRKRSSFRPDMNNNQNTLNNSLLLSINLITRDSRAIYKRKNKKKSKN